MLHILFSQIVLFCAYQAIQITLAPLIIIYIIYRQRRSKLSWLSLAQRLGFTTTIKYADRHKKIIWIHAVSVGETNSIQAFIAQLKREKPDHIIYVTAGTTTAHTIGQKILQADYFGIMPYDFLPCMLLAFWRIRPSSLTTVEAEWWPNLFLIARFLQIPIYGLNTRLSVRSLATYQRFAFIVKPLFQCFSHIFVQTADDKKNFESFGVMSSDITVLGNLKAYNVQVNQESYAKPADTNQPLTLLVGSLHPGELSYYLTMYQNLKRDFPALRLIIAPRHFSWQQELEQKLTALPYKSLIITPATPEKCNSLIEQHDAEIIAVCRLGELFSIIPYADIYYLGGTFVPVGGHSLLEPAVWGVPTIIGPHYFMTTELADQLESAGGLFKTSDGRTLEQTTRTLLNNQPKRHAAGKTSGSWLQTEATKVAEHLETLSQLL